jgi:RNA polymerase sigma-70 factor (ECF subfamily)
MALEPYPEALLEGLLDRAPEPLARHDPREAIRLGFVAALQRLPAAERGMVALCDVAGFPTEEAAAMLGLDAVASLQALRRARSTLAARLARERPPPPPPGSPPERALLAQFAVAFERADIDALLALVSEDVIVRLPPDPAEHRGRAGARRVLAYAPFRRVALVPTRANADPAFALHLREGSPIQGLLVLTLAGALIADLTLFRDPGALRCFTAPAPRPR